MDSKIIVKTILVLSLSILLLGRFVSVRIRKHQSLDIIGVLLLNIICFKKNVK